ncbi:MAG: DMT family transporter [Clostridiales bacterium]|nr:DMT family transporter [Clostridiales bacterium]
MSRRQSLLEIHVATLLFGLAGLFGKWLTLVPSLIVWGRVVFASLALSILLLSLRYSLRNILRENLLLLTVLGFVLAVHWVTFFTSIQVSTVAVGLLAYSCFPVFTVLLEPLFFKEKLDRTNLFLAAVCLSGALLIVPRFSLANAVYLGVLWGLVSGLSFALLTIFNRRLSQTYSSLAIAFVEDFAAAIFLLPFLFFYPISLTARDVLLLAFLGVVCTAGSHTLFIKGLRRVRAQTASIISALEPVYGIALAYLILREVPSSRTLGGGLVILSAALMISVREGRRLLNRSRPFS